MKMRAEVTCYYAEASSARAVAAALRPNNLPAPKGVVSTKARGRRVVTEVKLDGRLETLLATLDDLLACTSTAESVLKAGIPEKVS